MLSLNNKVVSFLGEFDVFCSTGSEVIKLFSCLTLLSMKFILLINVKNANYSVGILTLISWIID